MQNSCKQGDCDGVERKNKTGRGRKGERLHILVRKSVARFSQ